MNAALAQAAQAPSAPITTADGLVIYPERLYRGLAKLSATGDHLAADAMDHAVVYDPQTGLMEAVRAPGFDNQLSHDDATALAAQLTFAGFSDWQLPDVPEAIHSVDYTREDPAADTSLYPDAVSYWHWTRQQTAWSKDEAGSSRSFFYVFVYGGFVYYGYADLQLRARPVRRAAPASQCLVIGQ